MKRAREDLGIPDWYQDAMGRNASDLSSAHDDGARANSPQATAYEQLSGAILPRVSASVEPAGGTGVEFLHTSAVVRRDVVSMLELLQQASCNVLTHCALTLLTVL